MKYLIISILLATAITFQPLSGYADGMAYVILGDGYNITADTGGVAFLYEDTVLKTIGNPIVP